MAGSNETKPPFEFNEKEDNATFTCIVDGLKVERKIAKGLKTCPKNANIISETIKDQSINVAIQLKNSIKIDRFEIKRLPTQIIPEKSKIMYEKDKIIIKLKKKVSDPWRTFADEDYETIHLVKS